VTESNLDTKNQNTEAGAQSPCASRRQREKLDSEIENRSRLLGSGRGPKILSGETPSGGSCLTDRESKPAQRNQPAPTAGGKPNRKPVDLARSARGGSFGKTNIGGGKNWRAACAVCARVREAGAAQADVHRRATQKPRASTDGENERDEISAGPGDPALSWPVRERVDRERHQKNHERQENR
jgi:hypothetical protein